MSGADVTRAVANGNPQIPIVGLTARPGSPLTNQVTEAGARVMLTKPIKAEELVDHIHAVMGAPRG